GELGVRDVLGEVLVVGRGQRVPLVLARHRHQDLVEQGVAEPGDLRVGAELVVVAGLVLAYQGLAPAGGGPHYDHGARIVDRVAAVAVAGQVADGDLQGDGVDVDLGGG